MDKDDFLRFISYTKIDDDFMKIYDWYDELFDRLENKKSKTFIINKPRQCGGSIFLILYAIYKCINNTEYSIDFIFPNNSCRLYSINKLRQHIENSEKDKLSYDDGHSIIFFNGSKIEFRLCYDRKANNSDLCIVDEYSYIFNNHLDEIHCNAKELIMLGTGIDIFECSSRYISSTGDNVYTVNNIHR